MLVQRTVGEILPLVSNNFEGIKELITTLDTNLKAKDAERKAYKAVSYTHLTLPTKRIV